MFGSIGSCETYFNALMHAMRGVVSEIVDEIASELLGAYLNDKTVYVFGNGGSATTATHFACDLGKSTAQRLQKNARRFRVVALNDNVALMSAWANDYSYADIFAEQLRNLVRSGDVVFGISGSGKSPNVLNALRVAHKAGAVPLGLTGFLGGEMVSLCRRCLIIPSENMEVIEDLHLAVCHSLSTMLRVALAEINRERMDAFPHAALRPDLRICSDLGKHEMPIHHSAVSGMKLAAIGPFRERVTPEPMIEDHVDAD